MVYYILSGRFDQTKEKRNRRNVEMASRIKRTIPRGSGLGRNGNAGRLAGKLER